MEQNMYSRGAVRRWIVLLLVVLVMAGSLAFLIADRDWGPFRRPLEQASDYELAVWEWRAPDKFSVEELRPYMDFAASEKVKTIYLEIGGVIDINEVDDPAEKAKRQAGFDSYMRQYVQEAHRHGIQVHGLAGSVQWSDPDYRYLPEQIVDYVGIYNSQSTIEERLDGLQFDIEFYNQDSFKDNKRKSIEDFLETASLLQARVAALQEANLSLKLGFAIPYWFDNENGNIPSVDFKGQDKPVGYHLMDILNLAKNNYVVLMDYRDKTEGKNGSIEQAEKEVAYAGSQAKNVQVVIGQLTNDTKPVSTTFYDDGRDKLYTALAQLQGRFDDSSNFGGLAVHDYRSFKKLVED